MGFFKEKNGFYAFFLHLFVIYGCLDLKFSKIKVYYVIGTLDILYRDPILVMKTEKRMAGFK